MRDQLIRLILLVFLGCTTAFAQQATTTATTTGGNETSTTTLVMDSDSREVRQNFRELLQRMPPEVSRILKLDPTLFANESYLAHYPALAAFVKAHPEVTHSPDFYLEGVWIPADVPPETAAMRLWRDTVEGISIMAVMLTIIFSLTWLIKTVVEQRRWSRVQKIQSEVHNKLLDRFGSNEELLAYIQTPAGKRFLESAPIAIEHGPRSVSAPISRILWAVQVGIIVVALGFGLRVVSWGSAKEVAEMTSGMGTLAIAVGLGFVMSALASYMLSRRLGLVSPPETKEDAVA